MWRGAELLGGYGYWLTRMSVGISSQSGNLTTVEVYPAQPVIGASETAAP
jgi:hypothetical protein